MTRLIRRGKCPVCEREIAGAEQGGILVGKIVLRKHKPQVGALEWCAGWGALTDALPTRRAEPAKETGQ